jgi:hypothetical protein
MRYRRTRCPVPLLVMRARRRPAGNAAGGRRLSLEGYSRSVGFAQAEHRQNTGRMAGRSLDTFVFPPRCRRPPPAAPAERMSGHPRTPGWTSRSARSPRAVVRARRPFGKAGLERCWYVYRRIGRATAPAASGQRARPVAARGLRAATPRPAFDGGIAVGWCELAPRTKLRWAGRTPRYPAAPRGVTDQPFAYGPHNACSALP